MIQVHPSAVVDKAVELDEGVVIGPNCVIEGEVSIGAGTVVDANVVIHKNVRVGKNNHFFANCVIGGGPQMLGLSAEDEIGGLVIGDCNNIHEQVTIHPSIHPGKFTSIGSDILMMIGAHIGHDGTVEDKVVLTNYDQLAGHCKLETGAWLSGMVLLHQFVTIGKWSYVAGLAGISHDIPPFLTVSGHYPQRVRGVNRRGLARAGFAEEQQKKIVEAYKKIYRRGGAIQENARDLLEEDGLDENVRYLLESIIQSGKHRYGRYLEQFRD